MLSAADYYRDRDHVSHSAMKALRHSVAEFQAYGIDELTRDMLIGSAFHTLVLEPHEFQWRYVADHAWDVKRPTKTRLDGYGRSVLTAHEAMMLAGMGAAIASHPIAGKIMQPETRLATELPLTWVDAETGIACKCRPDLILTDGTIVDLKTMDDPQSRRLARQVWEYQYHAQADHYLSGAFHGAGLLNGQRFEPKAEGPFVFIFVGKSPPHRVVVRTLSDGFLSAGRRLNRETLQEIKRRREANDWAERVDATVDEIHPERWMGCDTDDDERTTFSSWSF